MIEDTFQRIAQTCGPKARFMDFSFDDERATVVAEDPMRPGAGAEFIVGRADIQCFGTGFFPRFRPEISFTLEATRSIDPARLKATEDEAARRIKLDGSAISLVEFSRGNVFVQPPRRLIAVEVRVRPSTTLSGGG